MRLLYSDRMVIVEAFREWKKKNLDKCNYDEEYLFLSFLQCNDLLDEGMARRFVKIRTLKLDDE